MGKLLAALSLRMRLTLLVGALALVITVDQGLEITRERDQSLAQIRARAVQIAVTGAAEQSGAIDDTRAILTLLAQIPLGTGNECVARLKQVQAASPALGSIFFGSLDGLTTCSSSTGLSPTDISKRPYFLTMMKTKAPVTSDYNVGLATKRPGIVIGVPIVREGSFVGGLFARLDAYWMSRLAESAAAESDADTILFDRTGTIIAAAPDPEDWIGRTIADEPELAAAFASPTGVVETALFDGAQRIVAHARLRPDAGEVLAVAIPKEAIVAPFERRTRTAMTKLGFTVLASVLLIWLGTERLIMRPLAAFAERARRIGEGDHVSRSADAGLLPELRPLGRTLDSMAAKLAAREAELREANALLAGLAATDPLTGLGNRRDFALRSAAEWARAIRERRWIAALAIDIDHFKPFNDRYGHAAGDVCLRKIAAALELLIRRPGDIVARTGGEEFVVLLPGAQSSDAASIAERMRTAIAELAIPHTGSETGVVTLSIGIADARPCREDIVEDLLARADAALYEAKQTGRDKIAVARSQPFRLAG
jgi:diguanylate cyclase (GGDEF)-like protein